MRTYLIPIDFSEASVNAAEFAAALSHQTDVKQIILLNAYYVSMYETTFASVDLVLVSEEEIAANCAERIKKLENLSRKLYKRVRHGVEIITHLNRTHLVRAVVENATGKKADVVILGSTGNSSGSDTHIGSHVVQISKLSPVPVIVVPPAYKFEPISRVVVACDFDKVKETWPLEALTRLLETKTLELLVVNVDHKAKHSGKDAGRIAEESVLHEMLKPFRPAYHYIQTTDIINGILHFAADKDAQLLIALPHKYSFFQSLLHTSVSRQLVAGAAVPVLLLK